MPEAALVSSLLPLAELHPIAAAGRLYAVLDSCDSPEVLLRVHLLGRERAPSLFSGRYEAEYSTFAPYLVQCDEDLVRWIAETLATEAWGIFAATPLDLAKLRLHLKKLLVVRDPAGLKMYFRFYDPRVLAIYLPTCTPGELREIFGPVESFGVLAPAADAVTMFAPAPDAGPKRTAYPDRAPVRRPQGRTR